MKSAFVTECVMISNDKIQEMTFIVRKISLKCLEMSRLCRVTNPDYFYTGRCSYRKHHLNDFLLQVVKYRKRHLYDFVLPVVKNRTRSPYDFLHNA